MSCLTVYLQYTISFFSQLLDYVSNVRHWSSSFALDHHSPCAETVHPFAEKSIDLIIYHEAIVDINLLTFILLLLILPHKAISIIKLNSFAKIENKIGIEGAFKISWRTSVISVIH